MDDRKLGGRAGSRDGDGAGLWICRECGLEVLARDAYLLVSIGWTSLDGDTGVCSPCRLRGLRGSAPGTIVSRAREMSVEAARVRSLSRLMHRGARDQRAEATSEDDGSPSHDDSATDERAAAGEEQPGRPGRGPSRGG